MIGIYKITSPTKKVYIGQTLNIKKRFKQYQNLHCKNQTKLYNSLIKYGSNNHIFEVLQLCDIEQLNELEKYYVDLFQTFNNKNGLNIRDGGGNRIFQSQETKNKISEKAKGRKHSEETKNKMSESKKGRIVSDDTKRKIGIGNSGKKHSDKMNLMNGIIHSKTILNTITGELYIGIKKAAEINKLNKGHLRNMLNGCRTNNTNLIYKY